MSAIKINFDTSNNPEMPTLILGDKSGKKYGIIDNIVDINVSDKMNDCPEISFSVYKYNNDVECVLWDKLINFMTVYCLEWNTWFEMKVDVSESPDILKNVILTRLAESELSQLNVYGLEANTETDIDREDYKPTIIFDSENPSASLLHRILTKAPHYSIRHVDGTIAKMQRTFSFDKISIKDAFDQIAEELNCLFVYHSDTHESDILSRQISVYDLESYCMECGHRGEFTGVCPKCGSKNISEGYGEDTNIFISSDGLGNNARLETNTDEVKNCFRLEAGDELMTSTIKNCSPSNSQYIYNFSDDMKEYMPKELTDRLKEYDDLYNSYNKEYSMNINTTNYNSLVTKYKNMDSDLKCETIANPITGYSKLVNVLYDTIDMQYYLQSSLMPSIEIDKSDAHAQMNRLKAEISPVAVESLAVISLYTVRSSILSMAKVIVDGRYKVSVNDGDSYNSNTKTWTGSFTIESYSDEEDKAVSENINVKVNDNYEEFVKQKIDKLLNGNSYDTTISWLFKIDEVTLDMFKAELKKYSYNGLDNFYKSCNGVIDIMIQQGINSDPNSNEYKNLCKPYQDRQAAILTELKVRESEINTVLETQNLIYKEQDKIRKALDLETYMGDLWVTLCSYIRETEYENTNYVSDGMTNAELIKSANEFITKATKDIYKASSLQHRISADIKNLLMIKEFKPLVDKFQCGNWIRIKVDENVYKLRLLEYDLSYEDQSLNVVFSDVLKICNGITDLQSVISQASSMASSYNFVKTQANQASKSAEYVDDMLKNGFDTVKVSIGSSSDNQSITWGQDGILCREYNDITSEFNPEQLKIINKGMYMTTDNWLTSKAAIGNFTYIDPITLEEISAYGVNAEVIIGRLLIGQDLGLYNTSGTLRFDDNGLVVTNGINTVTIDPNGTSVLNVKNNDGNVLSFDDDGDMIIVGNITAKSLTLLGDTNIDSDSISGLSDVAISGKYSDLIDKPNLSVYIAKDGVVGNTPTDGNTGFTVSSTGLLKASNAIIYGTIYSSAGKIGGWNIANNHLYTGTSSMASTTAGTYIGTDGIRLFGSNNQYINMQNGLLKAVGGKIYGSTIRCFNMSADKSEAYGLVSIEDGKFGIYGVQSYNGEDNYLVWPDKQIEVTYTRDGDLHLSTPWFSCDNDGTDYGISTSTGIYCHGKLDVIEEILSVGPLIGSSTLSVDGNVSLCKTGGTVYIYPQSNENGGEIRLINSDYSDASNVKQSVNIDNYENDLRFYLYDDDGKHHAARLYKDGTFATEKLRINGVDVKPNILTAGGESCYFTYTDDAKHFRPPNDDDVRLGISSYRWSEVWCNQSSINSASDERIKNIDGEIEKAEELIRAIHPIQYTFKDGTSKRIHYGFGAQTFRDDLISVGLDPNKTAAFLCDVTEEARESGITLENATEEQKIYGLRYSELISPTILTVQKLLNRVDELETKINELLNID